MEGNTYALEQLSYGLAGLVYAATAIHLGRKVPTPGPGGSTALFFFGAVSFTALWGWASLAGTLVDSTALTAVGRLADVLRYGCWYAFVLALLRAPTTSAGSSRRIGKLETLGALLVVAAAAAQLYAAEVVPALKIAPRIPAFALMALSVFGMFLIEQLFRNVQDDSRWNAKPVCL